MEAAEELFLRLISSFRIEDIRNAITENLDLAQIVKEELTEFVGGARSMVDTYRRAHPDKEKAIVEDPDRAAQRFVNWLKVFRPDLGYEIEAYKKLPMISKAGFVVKKAPVDLDHPLRPKILFQEEQEQQRVQQLQDVHVGYEWVKMNLLSFERMFS